MNSIDYIATYQKHGSLRKSAKALGISYSSFKHRYRKQLGVCKRCGKTRDSNHKLCQKCISDFATSRKNDPNQNCLIKYETPCLKCGEYYYIKKKNYNKTRKFCSYQCNSSYNNAGVKNPSYINGKSRRKYKNAYYKIRSLIIERDDHKCQLCNEKLPSKKIDVHHIDYNKDNNTPENLISLCKICHLKTSGSSQDNREFWKKLFNDNKTILERSFCYYRKNGFPYQTYKKEQIHNDFNKLCNFSDYDDININKKIGNYALNYFVREKWHAHRHNHISYIEAFNTDKHLYKALNLILNEGIKITDSRVRKKLRNISEASGCWYFSNLYSRYVYDKYLDENSVVFDPCAGWGNRMVSALSLNKIKTYCGFDINKKLIGELKKVVRFLGHQKRVLLSCSDSTKETPPLNADMIFTCPPYYKLETYSNTPITTKYNQWLHNFLLKLIHNSLQCLKNNGIFAICLKDITHYPILTNTKALLNNINTLTYIESIPIKNQMGYLKKSKKNDTILIYKYTK